MPLQFVLSLIEIGRAPNYMLAGYLYRYIYVILLLVYFVQTGSYFSFSLIIS